MLTRLVAIAVVCAACGHDHGPPRVQRLPKQDDVAPLRGAGSPRSPRIANYKIDARLDVGRHMISGSEVLTWTNTGQSTVDTLPFHLYMNAFKNQKSLFMQTSHGEMRGAHASDSGWGWIQVDSLQIGGTELANKLKYTGGDDQTVAELTLPQPIEPGATVDISFKFTEQLPEVFARTGYKRDFMLVGQWFPKIGVRLGPPGAEHWECAPLSATTEFFADFGTYEVTLTVPSTHVVAATGVLESAKEQPGGTRELRYRAEDVHDFVWMADPYMKVKTDKAKLDDGTVEIRVYYRPEQEAFAERHLAAAKGAIERFSAMFVPYPWPIMSIVDPPVDAAAGAGGMEYPTLVTTGGDSVFFRPGMRIPEFVTVHEVGHNWFQGILASNEPVEAWLDEGVNEWADAHVMNDLYGPRSSLLDWGGWQAEIARMRAMVADAFEVPSPIATAAYAFVDTRAYAIATYEQTLQALTTLERLVGSQKFLAAMKVYAQTYAFKHPTGRDMFATLAAALGQDLDWFFGPVFHEVGRIKLSVRKAECEPAHSPRGVFDEGTQKKTVTDSEAPELATFRCEVVVQNMGIVHVPVDIELRFADGSTDRRTWDEGGNWTRITLDRSSKLVEVRLDPDQKLLLESAIAHDVRVEGDGAASLRASARMSSWAQLLMQLVGP